MILVTGGAGFIGSNLVSALLAKGHRVRILDNFSTGKRENLAGFENEVEVVEGDLRDFDTVLRAVHGVNRVFHLAALTSVPMSVKDPRSTNDSNINGTLNLLVASRDASVKRVIYASSCAVYGGEPDLPKTERMRTAPLTPYALQKMAGEYYCRQFHALYGLQTLSLRYFNVFGPKQDPTSVYAGVISKFMDRIFDGRAPVVFGDGQQSRDFIYVDEVVRANLLALEAKKAEGGVINIATGSGTTINQLIDCLARLIGREWTATYESRREGDILHLVADVACAQTDLGFQNQVLFEEGLRKYLEWYREHGQP